MMLWMEVTQDELELPLAVARSAAELARIRGAKRNTITALAGRWVKGQCKRSKYVRAEVEDDD